MVISQPKKERSSLPIHPFLPNFPRALLNAFTMKFLPLFSIVAILMVSLATLSKASNSERIVKRQTYQTIANTFFKISQTIKGLDDAQTSAGQTGTPDFTKAAKGLAELSMEAELAENQLRGIGSAKLDDQTVTSIGNSVQESANHVKGITDMVKKGKQWFAQYKVTQIVVIILKINIAQFKELFAELNRHVDYTTLQAYSQPEIVFLCSMVDAVVTLDPDAISAGAKSYCSTKDGKQKFDANAFGGSTNTPTGYGSCGNSPTTFFQQAYSAGTIGTSTTSCSSGTQAPKSYSIPNNCLQITK